MDTLTERLAFNEAVRTAPSLPAQSANLAARGLKEQRPADYAVGYDVAMEEYVNSNDNAYKRDRATEFMMHGLACAMAYACMADHHLKLAAHSAGMRDAYTVLIRLGRS